MVAQLESGFVERVSSKNNATLAKTVYANSYSSSSSKRSAIPFEYEDEYEYEDDKMKDDETPFRDEIKTGSFGR